MKLLLKWLWFSKVGEDIQDYSLLMNEIWDVITSFDSSLNALSNVLWFRFD